MKATTCVRVVLPTDELVRMECALTMTVAELVRVLEKRSSFEKTNGVGGGYVSCDNNNCDADPATECHPKESVSKISRGKLSLIRTESELKPGSLVVDEVEELDILEFQFANPEWIPDISFRQSRRISPIFHSEPHKVVEAVRPASTAGLSCGYRTTQDQRNGTTEAVPTVSEVKLKEFIQHPSVRRIVLRRRGARRHPSSRNKRRVLFFPVFQENKHYSKRRKHAERVLLRAGMQLIERLQLVQTDVRELVFFLRDAVLAGRTLSTDELLSLARTMVNSLTPPCTDSSTNVSPPPDDTRENLVRRLSWNVAGRDGGVTVLLDGWVVSAEWGTFWRSQRREYACLCDNHMLYFFSSRTHCADFVFELGRERDGSESEASKRFLKDNSPLSQIDLSETDWTVRKSVQDESGKLHRNAFAFFDPNGRMRLVLDVYTAADATLWARLISHEMVQNKLFARMRQLNGETSAKTEPEESENPNPLTTWMEVLTESSTSIDGRHSLIIPLRSLYSQIDRMNGTARAERYRSWTLSQALKDLQRDRVKINGSLCVGASLEANILALTLEILRCTEPKRDNNCTESPSAEEMAALRFARQIIICSSRTHGGGDILDTLHLLFGNERFCICPDATSMEPIEISISKVPSTEAPLGAHVTMKMTYRVIPTDSISPMEDQSYTNGDTSVSIGSGAEFKIVGTYSQRLSCHFIEANDIEGSVLLEFGG
ncbi:hypothetical protein V7S43_003253 [Phytophthora oleae]|uniref:PH domain-containing protein n=1 Tax=Phytophthora oleae TaxID=2107226 RepID=A0ABD3FX31_9STRA